MTSKFKRPRRLPRGAASLSLALGSLALASCASVPKPGIGEAPRSGESYATTSLQATGLAWPGDGWWTNYADPQLTALIDEAMAGAPDLRAAQARVRRAQALVTNSRADLLPSINAGAGVQGARQSYNLGFPAPEGWNDSGQASLNLNWEIDFWGKNRAALAAATSDAQAARAEEAAARLALSTAIASDYAVLAGLFADRAAAAEAVLVRIRTHALMEGRRAEGLEHSGAVQRAASAAASAQAELVAVDEAINLVRHRLAALVGAGPDRGLGIVPPATRVAGPMGLPQNLPADLMGRRPDIAAARLRVEAASNRIEVAEKRFYPNINLAAVVGLQSLNLVNFAQSDSFAGFGGAAISLPIFQGGRLRAQYRGAESDYDLAVAEYDRTVAQALREVADAATGQRALGVRIAHTRAAHLAAQSAFTVANNRYRGGLATYLEVLAAEDALIASRRALAALETRSFALEISLIRALGGGFGA